ncbi:LOW QUALITY PROTEIN: Set domain-containing hypothetical protein [Phytophthora megakarya]|uniref:Uncharacterized protein n=1 Tax=Phytophthora megakarya TaxID=4795 RepID=A0A225VUE3_9STRA|nr:LOW QUALITY PROTEIN: Set domain-containing hypothetical protein [Phytophthora megakarya]
MVGLSGPALARKPSIEYYSRDFVAGDPRGHPSAIVLQVDGARDAGFPVHVDTGELLPRNMMMRRITDGDGSISGTKWSKLRTFHLVLGTFNVPSRVSALADVLETVIRRAYKTTRRGIQDMREGKPSTELQSDEETTHPKDESYADIEKSSTRSTASDIAVVVEDTDRTRLKEAHASEGTDHTPPTDMESVVELAASEPTDCGYLMPTSISLSKPPRSGQDPSPEKAESWRLACESLKKAA